VSLCTALGCVQQRVHRRGVYQESKDDGKAEAENKAVDPLGRPTRPSASASALRFSLTGAQAQAHLGAIKRRYCVQGVEQRWLYFLRLQAQAGLQPHPPAARGHDLVQRLMPAEPAGHPAVCSRLEHARASRSGCCL